MSDKASKNGAENDGKQSPGNESTSTSTKRNSGLFSFFKWLKPITSNSRESLNSDKGNNSNSSSIGSGSCDSLNSLKSSGTVASFSFVDPKIYAKNFSQQKNIASNPETDTYKARLKQRDKRREKDKNLTLRKKYNLFFNRDSLLKNSAKAETTKSLPLMTKPTIKEEPKEEGFHRRTNSDSSKIKKAGAYLHVKGKRKAPQPPAAEDSSASLRRRSKRLAPPPPDADKGFESSEIEKLENSTPPVYRKEKINKESKVQQKVTKFDLSFLRRETQSVSFEEQKTKQFGTTTYEKEPSNSQSLRTTNTEETKLFNEEIRSAVKTEETKNLRLKTINTNEEVMETSVSKIFPRIAVRKDEQKQMNNVELRAITKKKEDEIMVGEKKNAAEETTNNEEKIKELNKLRQFAGNKSSSNEEIISNDSLKLDHGILKPLKGEENIYSECSPFVSQTTSSSDASKPWYKRQEMKREFFKTKHENKYEPIEKLPEVSFNRTNSIDSSKEKKKDEKLEKKKDDKRKSGISLLANISELDREAAEILQKEKLKNTNEMPEFMKLKNNDKPEDVFVPKRRSARDLIAKFNAITNVTKVTVNTALFGTKDTRKNYFANPKEMKKQQEAMLESHKKRIELIDKKINKNLNSMIPLGKSESASVVKKPETPKCEPKSWNCPKCYVENEYWRIICHVCSAIKPYFDDLSASPLTRKNDKIPETQYEKILERSKTQIGFSALAQYNTTSGKNDDNARNFDKKEEKERLKKMLIEMKNSLPKKSMLARKHAQRSSVIVEKPETEVKKIETHEPSSDDDDDSSSSSNSDNEDVKQEEKVASILISTKSTIYENIKMRKTPETKPNKVSSSVQTSSVIKTPPEPTKRANVTAMVKKKNSFEPMKVQDFEDIYGDRDGKTAAKIYANLARNDELSLFFNMPKNLTEMKDTLSKMKLQNRNKDTIEINRLLRRLEVAIGKGNMTQAADFAKELAQLKVNCSVIRQRSSSEEKEAEKDCFSIDMYVEDKISHRGPFPLQVKPEQTVGELKLQVEKEFEIPITVQRWILGKELATNDSTTLKTNNITNGCPVFLYLVAPDTPALKNITQLDKPSTSSVKQDEKSIKLYPDLSLTETPSTNGPKIIDAIPKALENTNKTNEVTPEKHIFNKVVTQTVTTVLYAPKTHLAQPEDVEEYDAKTLKPQTIEKTDEWECHLCTLLNPTKSNICAVCATVRQNVPKKMERKRISSVPKPNAPPLESSNSGQTYLQLMNLDNEDLVQNSEPFECLVCFMEIPKNEGVTLRECLHQFCKECLRNNVEFSEEAEVKCPYRDNEYSCNIALQDREIKALVSKEKYDQHLAKSMAQAENQIDKSFHCKTPDCRGWCIFEDNVNEFKCPVCKRINCLTCQAIHMGLNCKQYQERMTQESECDENARQTRKMLDEMVERGEALKCPTCQVIMMKKWGCDWLRCSVCKTEICWVTRGPRWGPGGKGDISGGCQCGVNGVKCHPKCNYCH